MNLNNIDFNKLHTFHAVMRFGSYSQTTEHLNLTRSAISQAISGLESQLGFPLFLRKGKKLIPTSSAHELYQIVNAYQASLQEALNKSKNQDKALQGTVRIGAYLEFAKHQLVDLLKDFSDQHPQINIKFRFDSPSRLQKLLESDSIDLSLSIYPIQKVKNIQSTKIYKDGLVLICPKPWASKLQSMESILEAPFIGYFENSKTLNKWIFCHYKKRRSKQSVKIYAATAEMVLESVKKEIGIGLVPNYIVDSEVQVIRPTERQLTDYIWLSQFKNQYSNTTHKAFYKFLLRWFNIS